ncbi:MAG: LD-carboxypeptidase [Lachnospiraceae bacterium]|nr:LD-carboxypeptidase [Lachnospiraceae bacterium]
MNYPNFLKPNGRIGFIAPSFGCTIEPYLSDFQSALEEFKGMGYTTVPGPNCFADEGIGISNTPEKCAAEVNDYFTNDKSDVIISCGGGELMCEILPFVDFEKIASSTPKWFMGYSDNTNLTFLLNTLCDTASIYSVCASKFAKDHHQCVDDAFDVLCGKKLSVSNYDKWFKDKYDSQDLPDDSEDGNGDGTKTSGPAPVDTYINEKTGDVYDVYEYKQYLYVGNRTVDSASMSGRLIGGCMDCLVNLTGTRFDRMGDFNDRYKDDGIIWFLEACDLGVMSIRRALWQMENAGWFEHVRGFLIGRPLKFDDTFGDFDHYDAVLGILGKYNVPILMDLDIGHQFPQMPVISGACANVEAAGNSFNMEFLLK